MLLKDKRLNDYIEKYIDTESPVLCELNRQTHLRIVNPNMLSGHLQGSVLSMLSKMIAPKYILEIGTYTGYSAICMAQGLKEGGMLHTIDINDEIKNFAESYITKAGVNDKITMHTGDAKLIIPQLDIKFDLAFIDADKENYLNYYKLVIPKINSGGYILVDNIFWDGKVLDTIDKQDVEAKGILQLMEFVKKDKTIERTILPVRDGLMIIRKK